MKVVVSFQRMIFQKTKPVLPITSSHTPLRGAIFDLVKFVFFIEIIIKKYLKS